jgi:hypothetical protein
MRGLFEECVTEAEWRECIGALLRDAKQGNVAAFKELAPWVVGRVPEETRHSGMLATTNVPDLSKLTDDELATLERLVGKADPNAADA